MKALLGFPGRAWRWVLHWLERGDLVPLLVIVSAGHYVVVLQERDWWPVAAAIGLLVDIGHFRSVRIATRYKYTKEGQGRWQEWLTRWAVAAVMTAVSFSYHLRFYDGDLALAVPMPLLIAALAYFERKDRISHTAGAEDATQDAEAVTVEAEEGAQRIANIDDWRAIVRSLDGKCGDIDAARVAKAVEDAGLALPSPRTLHGWAQRTRKGTL